MTSHDFYILVTQAGAKGLALCQQIREKGGQAVHFPTIDFVSLTHTPPFQQALALLPEQDWIIFNSPQAVAESLPFPLPSHCQLAAVGASTASALQAAGYQDIIFPADNWCSEGLLAMPAFQGLENKKIAIIRGEGGREYLAQTLRERGATVLPVLAYRRVLAKSMNEEVLSLLQKTVIKATVCTSYEAVLNLKILLGASFWPMLFKIPLIVVSERIKILAHDLGFQTIWVARNASHPSILELLAEKGFYDRTNHH